MGVLMFKKVLVLGLALLMAGCASTGTPITDYTNRSIVYGWLDIDDVDGNHMYAGYIRQFSPPTKEPYYSTYIDEFEGGYLVYFYGLPNGAFKLDSVKMQSCLGFVCSNTVYTYNFGTQGNVASVKIKKPGTYYLGSYKLAEEDTGIFEQSKFSVTKAKKGPSKKAMLKHILENAPNDHPVVAKRIEQSMRSVR